MKMRFLFIAALAVVGMAYAQDEGGGGGGRGGGGGGGGVMPSMPGRGMPQALDRMENFCKLTKDQKKQFKTVMDAAQKEAEPVRKQLLQNEKDLAAAAVKAKSSADVKAQVDGLGAASAQMAQIELKTFAQLYKALDDDQKKTGGGQLFNSFFNHQYFSETNGIFMGKNWQEK
jgi:Spy/CpxP family protein refolding chaperone